MSWKRASSRHSLAAKGIKTGRAKKISLLNRYFNASSRQQIIDIFYFEKSDKKIYVTPSERKELLRIKHKIDRSIPTNRTEDVMIQRLHEKAVRAKPVRLTNQTGWYIVPTKKTEVPKHPQAASISYPFEKKRGKFRFKKPEVKSTL
jgi:hypothetical protein